MDIVCSGRTKGGYQGGLGGSPHPVPLWEALFSFFLPFLDFFGPSLSPGLAEVF